MPLIPAVLAVLWAALLFGGLLSIKPSAGLVYLGRMPARTRLGSSAALAVAAWAWAVQANWGLVAILIALGMTLGVAGDCLLSRITPLKHPLAAGMGAFALGHVAYSAALLSLGATLGASASAGVLPWLAFLAAGAVGWYLTVQRGQPRDPLRLAALPYALLLASMAGLAAGLAIQFGVLWLAAIGGALFMASDLIVAARRFRNVRFPAADDIVWLTYGPGQALIVFGVNLALRA